MSYGVVVGQGIPGRPNPQAGTESAGGITFLSQKFETISSATATVDGNTATICATLSVPEPQAMIGEIILPPGEITPPGGGTTIGGTLDLGGGFTVQNGAAVLTQTSFTAQVTINGTTTLQQVQVTSGRVGFSV